VVLSAVDGSEVESADRERQLFRVVAIDADVWVPRGRSTIHQSRLVGAAVAVPEVDEGVLELPDRGAHQTQVRVTPLGGVETPDVVTADEPDRTVDNENLAVISA
jgi:hypothetical protein